jgi:hypothetical protein
VDRLLSIGIEAEIEGIDGVDLGKARTCEVRASRCIWGLPIAHQEVLLD